MLPKVANTPHLTASVTALTSEGRGVARVDNKAVFIDDALPGDRVSFHYTRRKRHYDEGALDAVLEPSPWRVEPPCRHHGRCGGCCLQHLAGVEQIRIKQTQLVEDLARIGGVQPGQVLPLLTGEQWGYRRKARLGVRYVIKKGKLLVGFREKQGRYLADVSRCDVLHPAVGLRLQALQSLIAGMKAYQHIPQIEVAVGDDGAALVFRHLQPLEPDDLDKLRRFARWYAMAVFLQPGSEDSVTPLWPEHSRLGYRLPSHDLEIRFGPTDFIQVNADINRRLVDLVMGLFEPRPGERALDLFCGVGNFTLPMARAFGEVTGVEGDAGLVGRASENAAHNGIANATFHVWDLSTDMQHQPWWPVAVDKVLLDPPRTGAREAVTAIAFLKPARIIYVSCNPATLARDADTLVHRHGYRLSAVAAVDMFPHTAHMEAVAVFDRP
jgi:23S rRNA (uracil1939-C5)-methyltransferase